MMKKIYQAPSLLEVTITANCKLMANSEVGVGSEYGGTGVLAPGFDFETDDEY